MYIFLFLVNNFIKYQNIIKFEIEGDFMKSIQKHKQDLSTCIILLILLAAFIIVSAYSYVSAVSYDIADSVFRLHVIANSDSAEDQALKYKVRDSLLNYMNSLVTSTTSKDEAMEIVTNNIDNFKNIAEATIKENGYNYSVNITVGKHSFPTKYYGDVSLPAGIYDALRVEIGSASGQNWWCVMFPPLCFVDISSGIVPEESKESLKNNLNDEEYDLITVNDSSSMNFKFKIVELIENIKINLAQK